jgi:glutamyl-Q tRNA(Asp) synthetase
MPDRIPYRGRFAPSPTGPLHRGSLFTALAGYLDAKAHGGVWLLRIDDLDTPRNQPGAVEAILDCLHHFGLHWDETPRYQSAHLADYQHALQQLIQQHRLYACHCSRKSLLQTTTYPGHCRERNYPLADAAVRIASDARRIDFHDALQGMQHDPLAAHGDFIVRRKDGVFAYQLACAVDEQAQQISHILRGVDLLDSTPKQIYLQQCLGYATPQYAHLPVIVDRNGQKLSKQTLAAPVDTTRPGAVLWQLLTWLRQNPPALLKTASPATLLDWGIAHWHKQNLSGLRQIVDA